MENEGQPVQNAGKCDKEAGECAHCGNLGLANKMFQCNNACGCHPLKSDEIDMTVHDSSELDTDPEWQKLLKEQGYKKPDKKMLLEVAREADLDQLALVLFSDSRTELDTKAGIERIRAALVQAEERGKKG